MDECYFCEEAFKLNDTYFRVTFKTDTKEDVSYFCSQCVNALYLNKKIDYIDDLDEIVIRIKRLRY